MPRKPLPPWTKKTRRYLLYLAGVLAVVLFGLDRYAAYAYRPAADSRQVVIYTTAWCPHSKALRASLAASGIPFVERDVETSLSGQLGFWTLRGRGVPVAAIGAEVIYGYDVPRLAAASRTLGYRFSPMPSDSGPGEPAQSMLRR
jgi:mycoredoxin